MKRIYLILLVLAGVISGAKAQLGGQNVYEFVNLSPSARVTALGGNLITVKDFDAALAYANPSLLNASMDDQLTFATNIHFAGIHHGFFSYAKHLEKSEITMHGGVQYINYGTFDQADIFGNRTGVFKASEYAVTIGAARQIYGRLSVGANLKVISSQFESYNSFGMLGDLSATYYDTAHQLLATLVLRNMGGQLTSYEDVREAGPFEVQFGISKRLKYLPLRLSVIAHNLNQGDILYDDPAEDEDSPFLEGFTTGATSNPDIDNFFRHLIFNAEFLIGKTENFRLRLGYNHLRRKELTVDAYRSLSGFSFGFGLKVSKFRFDYGHAIYHLAGGTHHFSISTNLREFR